MRRGPRHRDLSSNMVFPHRLLRIASLDLIRVKHALSQRALIVRRRTAKHLLAQGLPPMSVNRGEARRCHGRIVETNCLSHDESVPLANRFSTQRICSTSKYCPARPTTIEPLARSTSRVTSDAVDILPPLRSRYLRAAAGHVAVSLRIPEAMPLWQVADRLSVADPFARLMCGADAVMRPCKAAPNCAPITTTI